MEYRKLISFGKNSYIVSMPKQWIEKNKLKKGDLMSITEKENELTISLNNSNIQAEPKEITIESDNKKMDLIKAEIVSAYLTNYDTIIINSSSLEKSAIEIKRILRNLTGMEVMEQTAKRIVAKDLINKNEISVKTLIRRMDIITRAMMEDAIASIDGENHYESIFQRDTDVNRLNFLSHRVIREAIHNPALAKSLKMGPWELFATKIITTRLEMIADSQKRIARYLKNIKLRKSSSEELKQIYNEMREKYLQIMKSYYNNDKQLALEVEVTNRDRILACEEFYKNNTGCSIRIKRKEAEGYCTELSRIVKNLKAMTTSVKHISRAIISMG